MEIELRQHINACAAAYAQAKKLEMVTVSRLATGDWRFFDRVNGGASFTARKYDAVIRWFADNWPNDLAWPEGVPAPDSMPKASDEAA